MPEVLKGKKVVVIGGSSGIGFAVARGAIEAGATVIVGSSNPENVSSAAERLGTSAGGYQVDTTDESQVASFFERVGPFDHLVYTAGDWGGRQPVLAKDWDLGALAALFNVRFWGAVAAVKYGHQSMPADGSITLTDGTVAHRPRKGGPISTAMAGAVEHLGQGLAVDLAPIRVNVVCPGLVMTEVWARVSEEQIQQRTARQPIPRGGTPEEVAEAYLHLMRAGFTTGQVLRVDGGSGLT